MREHGADDVDDRVERADFVQVHLLDRHLVNRAPPLPPAAETAPSRGRARRRQRRAVDEREDLRKAVVVMPGLMIVLVRMHVDLPVRAGVCVRVLVSGAHRLVRRRTWSPTRRRAGPRSAAIA